MHIKIMENINNAIIYVTKCHILIKKCENMTDLLNDESNLKLLREICSGNGVEVNISELSRSLKKHRNTIRDRLEPLFQYNILNKPIYPFFWLYREYPLMVLTLADLPRDEQTKKFIEEDPHIFAAFFKKEGEYNTFIIQYHRDIYNYQQWRSGLVKEGKLPPRETRYPSEAMFFSNQAFIKYNPSALVNLIESDVNKIQGKLNDYKLDALSLQMLKKLAYGEGIQTNENYLSEKIGIHRKTIERRITSLLKEKIILKPTCRFPRFVVPPNYTLVISLVEIKKHTDKIEKALNNDPHVPLILRASTGRYTHLIFSCFYRTEDHAEWQEIYDQRFSGCLGAVQNTYLSPTMTFSIAQQFVSLGIINRKLNQIHGKKLVDMMKSS
jgi:DNA-binding Lrp family transcriptional regulator